RQSFAEAVAKIPAILEVYRMAGDTDYLLRVSVPDMSAFDALYRQLTDAVPIKNVTSHFAMERIKYSTAYPIDTEVRQTRVGREIGRATADGASGEGVHHLGAGQAPACRTRTRHRGSRAGGTWQAKVGREGPGRTRMLSACLR